MVSSSSMTADDARRAVQHCFRDMIFDGEHDGGFVPQTYFADLEIAEQRGLALERISDLDDQIARSDFDGLVKRQARLLAGDSGQSQSIPTARQLDMMSGVARAMVEQQRWFLLRLEDRLARYIPQDELFRDTSEAPSAPCSQGLAKADAIQKGPTLSEAISQYLAYGQKRWTVKTHKSRVVQLGYLAQHIGVARPLGSIAAEDVRGYRNAISTLRANHGRTSQQSFIAKQTDNVAQRIAIKTASLIYEPARAFFGWATDLEGLITDNPARNVKFAFEKKAKGLKPRRPFHVGELEKIFRAPTFTGCRSPGRRFTAGSHIIRDGKFWLPILGMYTGARLGELVQLHVGDVVLDGPIPHISINENNATGASEKKHVKSAAGIRLVPLHPDLITIGFEQFVRGLSKRKKKPSDRLFPDIAYGNDGQASTVASKYFRRFLTSIGLTDPAAVFHSLRHGAEDALRNALIPQYVIDRIIGHTDGSTSAGYGQGVDLETSYTAISAMKLKICIPELWQNVPEHGAAPVT